ncbi:DUF3303 domain-containing protein [Ruegeria hyattellae]|uniref:DUF3303 domain-containing protein n=1 Tax=Ruegeria hyattellae TaxID=3233337 RepID=UPI00355BDDCB
MYFHIHFEFTPETRDAALKRFMDSGDGIPDGAKPISRPWFSTTLLEEWGIVESDDASVLATLLSSRTDLAVDHIAPVISGGDVLKLLPLKPNPNE